MKAKQVRTRLLVVDSDVIAAATGNENPRSKICLLTLTTIQQMRHRVLLTPEINREWNNRFPRFAALWLKQMKSRGLLELWEEEPESGISGALQKLGVTSDILTIMLKDKHLLEAAKVGDQTILSMDETAYYHFFAASASISQLRRLMWVSPERISDTCVAWLQAGAKPETKRCIGIRPRRGTL